MRYLFQQIFDAAAPGFYTYRILFKSDQHRILADELDIGTADHDILVPSHKSEGAGAAVDDERDQTSRLAVDLAVVDVADLLAGADVYHFLVPQARKAANQAVFPLTVGVIYAGKAPCAIFIQSQLVSLQSVRLFT